MLNLLTKLMALYSNSLSAKRTARKVQIQADLAEATELGAKVASLAFQVEREEEDLQTYLDNVE